MKSQKPKPIEIKKVNTTVKSKEEDMYEVFDVSSYTAGYESTQKRRGEKGYGITASGKKVRNNHTAACPRSMEFGTKLYIPYFDITFTCEDRGGAIKEGKLDIYMSDLNNALEFGRKDLEVQIIKERVD